MLFRLSICDRGDILEDAGRTELSRRMKTASAMQNKPKIGAANIDMGKLKGPAEEAVTSAELISATGIQVIPQVRRM